MVPGISTRIFLPQRLEPALLSALAAGGARAIELWAARHHLDYTDRAQMREIAAWFGAHDVLATLHAPLTADAEFSRHASPTVDLLASDRGRRIAAMDEIKRALEIAEHIPVRTCVVHLGSRDSRWSEHALEYSLTAIEHLKAFAAPLGVKLLLENLPNEVATPAHLLEILRIGHFDTCRVCLDTGHVHLSDETFEPVLAELAPRLQELHLNDNDGKSDAHLWPASGSERPAFAAEGTIAWEPLYRSLAGLPPETGGMLEIADTQAGSAAEATRLLRVVLSHQARLLEGEPA